MPTTRRRYAITDTGETGEMLDLAARRWPEVTDRKALLLRLAAAGRDQVARELQEVDHAARAERQRRAFARVAELVDLERLESDAAWR